jgi:hypothetical protein
VAHFFRLAFGLLRVGGVFGLIATNTIGQGDTRASGLAPILHSGAAIVRTKRRVKWPGEAAVVVSVVHVLKGRAHSAVLDGREVGRISAYLVEGDLDTSPAPLVANAGKAFQGSVVLGMGFTFDDHAALKGEAESLATMHALIEKESRNAKRIFPYIGGEEVNNDPRHAHHRYVIDFGDFPLRRDQTTKSWTLMTVREREDALRYGVVPLDYSDPVASDWPDLLEIVCRLVKPERAKNPDRSRREIWWKHTRRVPALRRAIASLERVTAINCGACPQFGFALLNSGSVYAHSLAVVAFSDFGSFATLQSRIHEAWARFFSSTLEDRLRYAPSDCFRTFPFPESFETDTTLETAGEAYHTFRADLMIERDEGLTKTYNRFHARGENAPDIARLRALHAEMDAAVLRAYGWNDLADRAAPEFIEQDADEGKTPKTRFDWPVEFKDEVLARLLALNVERAAAERAAGLTAILEDEEDEDIDEAAVA